MTRRLGIGLAAGAMVSLGLPGVALAAPLPLLEIYSTGVDNTGTPIADGAVDPHWSVVASTDPLNPGPALYAFPANLYPINGPWVDNTATGRWVTLGPAVPDTAADAVFEFEVKIDLRGFLPTSAGLTIVLSADDDYVVTLNGAPTGIARTNAYSALATHSINTGWVSGINTMRLSVNNSGGGPTGIFVSSVSGSAEPDLADPDADGLSNYIERLLGTNPNKADTDDDGIPDGVENKNKNGTVDPGESNPTKADTDSDGIPDGVEDKNKNGVVDAGETDPTKPDTDGDGIPDGVEDKNKNGIVDVGETDPTKADTDGDGLPDGIEDTNKNGIVDAGETDPKKADTDEDGLSDGAEDKNKDGLVSAGETDPRNPDTDAGGAKDGDEVDGGGNPLDPADDAKYIDTDGDRLPDVLEAVLGTNPNDKDSDHDGIPDGEEVGPDRAKPVNTDGDALIDALDADDDNDGILTKDERDDAAKAGVPDDVDGDGRKNWLDTDADNDGVPDGVDGRGDDDKDGIPNFLDPASGGKDSDGDGLSDDAERGLGTNPNVTDSDGDGIPDGAESPGGRRIDTDGDGIVDPLDPDDDNDGIPTKVEIELAKASGRSDDVDGDGNKNYLDQDADGDGLPDAAEGTGDTDGNGVADFLEPSLRGSLEGGGLGCASSPRRPSPLGPLLALALAAGAATFRRRRR